MQSLTATITTSIRWTKSSEARCQRYVFVEVRATSYALTYNILEKRLIISGLYACALAKFWQINNTNQNHGNTSVNNPVRRIDKH